MFHVPDFIDAPLCESFRDREIRTALRANQIAGFFSVPSRKSRKTIKNFCTVIQDSIQITPFHKEPSFLRLFLRKIA